MPLYKIGNKLEQIDRQSLAALGIRERDDLQRVLRDNIESIAPEVLVIAEEFSEWSDSRRRIDLLGLHKDGSLAVIELKRTDDGGHMELQAIRYAAMVAPLTFDRATEVFEDYLSSRNLEGNAEDIMLKHLEWESVNEGEFGAQVRIILAGPDFGPELITAVLWLNEQGLDITCVRLIPYSYAETVFLDIQQFIPIPEAGEYTVRIREKNEVARATRRRVSRDHSRFDVKLGESTYENLPKRRAIFEIVKHLVSSGVSPELIYPVFKIRRFFEIDKEVHSEDEFILVANSIAEENGGSFNPVRWFTADSELLHYDGRTFAFSNQWGKHTEARMNDLIKKFEDHQISFSVSP